MIDTIVLTLSDDNFHITDHSKFSPSTLGLYEAPFYPFGKNHFIKCVQNPTREDYEQGIYKPRLSVTRYMGTGAYTIRLRIEFSIPKLIFGNNFDEITDGDFEKVVKQLMTRLNDMGVFVVPETLRNAPVSALHCSKNIVLTDYSIPSQILKELQKIDVSQRLDINQTDFRNEGHSLKFRSNSFEISLYDKKKDLQQAKISEKRAIEKDNAIQLELFKKWQPQSPFEILRMEIRLNQRQKIKQVFQKLKINSNLSFNSIFKAKISQKVLLHYFDDIRTGYSLLKYQPRTTNDFIADFKINNPGIRMGKMLKILAVKKAISEMGIREFREVMRIYGNRTWERLKKDLSGCQFPERDYSILKPIENVLYDFRAVKLQDFGQKNILT